VGLGLFHAALPEAGAAELDGQEQWVTAQSTTATAPIHIDMDKSEALMAWEHFNPGKPGRPKRRAVGISRLYRL
jgi:hypothetical protein